MSRVVLKNNVTLRGARRVLSRRNSSIALTLRNGNIYTYHKTPTVQPNTASQLNARNLLKQANVLARKDLLIPGRREYWTRRAASTGYKTAIGCARAHFISLLKSSGLKKASSPRPSSPISLPPMPRRVSRSPRCNSSSVMVFSRLSSRVVFSPPEGQRLCS